MSQLQSVDIEGLQFPVLSYDSAIDIFEQWIEEREAAHQVCIANVHTVMTASNDADFFELNNKASMITMDGLPLVWYANLVHKARIADRVCGPELMLRCFEEGQSKGWKHFLLGGREEVLEALSKSLLERYPEAEIVGAVSPPFRPLSEEEDESLVAQINESNADFLWVGLGAPKQEMWIASHTDRVQVPVNLGVGAAFDFHSGFITRAPVAMQKLGLEWLYRLYQDPRLWKRYASTNPPFLYRMLLKAARKRLSGKTIR